MFFKRNVSFLSKLRGKPSGETPDISHSISLENLPKITGNGPFIELPSFEALGHKGSLLNVTMPALLKLNIRSGSIVAMNGSLNNLRTSLRNLSLGNPLLYQELSSTSPVLILLSGGPHFTVLELNEDKRWEVTQLQSVIAWTGFNLKLNVGSKLISGLYKLGNYSRVSTEGKGKLVLGASSDIFEVKLQENEEIYVDPSALLAYTSPSGSPIEFKTIQGDIYSSIPRTGLLDSTALAVQNAYSKVSQWVYYWYVKFGGTPKYVKIEQAKPTEGDTSQLVKTEVKPLSFKVQWDKFSRFIALQWRRKRRDDIYVRILGPCEILLESRLILAKRTFTKQELASIYETL